MHAYIYMHMPHAVAVTVEWRKLIFVFAPQKSGRIRKKTAAHHLASERGRAIS